MNKHSTFADYVLDLHLSQAEQRGVPLSITTGLVSVVTKVSLQLCMQSLIRRRPGEKFAFRVQCRVPCLIKEVLDVKGTC